MKRSKIWGLGPVRPADLSDRIGLRKEFGRYSGSGTTQDHADVRPMVRPGKRLCKPAPATDDGELIADEN